MPKILVIADDYTGANDTGILLKEKGGFEAVSFLSVNEIEKFDSDRDVFCISTDTRDKKSQYSYNLIRDITCRFKNNVKLISKRIDSTLRGNVGSEIDAVLDELGPEYRAVVVASYPSSARICLGGCVLVNGVPLEKTNVSSDIKTPVKSSSVIGIIKSQSRKSVGYVPLGDVLRGAEFLKKKIEEKSERIIVIDAVNNEDIMIIADACTSLKEKIVSVDPGPFTAFVSINRLKSIKPASYRSLMVIGSITELTRKQLKYFERHQKILIYNVNVNNLIDNFEDELGKTLDYIKKDYRKYKYLCITTSLVKFQMKHGINLDLSDIISDRLNKIARKILDMKEFNIKLIYLSGGDTAQGFLKNVNSTAMELLEEIIPLAVYGKIIGGEFNGLNVVTKGGLIGDETSMVFIMSTVEKNIERGKRYE
ncbi:four-carbon acid sugar kinase family protein [Clostridium luticellarii]|jgi:uncharacterized protein YgbK (DUF1537 family)|uniref:four-carbon acid sugar kinase family protein n=1 Tax=Clostridium luticellarii TaxID=1691940 RepID=UPI0023576DC9|nr:four-carbon acid sugar kinase family protein [Clostridium luticellarii]MCI1945379.1 four-carbon acid sugar kinase family protein [Clostridium luticellarii]MCI1968714.1 four-carbon acid sugar kinase family protein [Clostridium luticellarii]